MIWLKTFLFAGLLLFTFQSESQTANISGPELRMFASLPLVLSWPTNAWRFSLESTTNVDLTDWKWVYDPRIAIGTNYYVTNSATDSVRFFRLRFPSDSMCRSQLAQVGLAFRVAEGDFNKYPFLVSTNFGGTKELRALGADGFDTNAFYHFRVLSNYLSNTALFVCPSDLEHNPAVDFSVLNAENTTYKLRTVDSVTSDNPDEIMIVCPIHGIIVYADGHVP